MNKLLLTFLLFFAHAGLLHGMDYAAFFSSVHFSPELYREGQKTEPKKEKSPITLPQIYQHFSETLPLDITRNIFSFQLGNNNLPELLNRMETCKSPVLLVHFIGELLSLHRYLVTNEVCIYFFKQDNISICDIQNENKETCLHVSRSPWVTQILLQSAGNNKDKLLTMENTVGCTALHYAATSNRELVKLLLNAAGNNAYTLLTTQAKNLHTALHFALSGNDIEIIKLLLQAAGNNVYTLLSMQDAYGWSALHTATKDNDKVEIIDLLLDAAGEKAQELITTYRHDIDTNYFPWLDKCTPYFVMRPAILTYMERKERNKKV